MHHTPEDSWNHTGPGDLTSLPLQDPDRRRYVQTAEFIVREKKKCFSTGVIPAAWSAVPPQDDLEKDVIPSEGTRDGTNFLKMDRHASVSTAAPRVRTHRKHWN